MSKKSNGAPLSDIKSINSILAKYFSEYYITSDGMIHGTPYNDAYRAIAVVSNEMVLENYANTYFDALLSKKFFADAKITLTKFIPKSDCILFDMYRKGEDKPYDTFKLYKINHEGINYQDIGVIDVRHQCIFRECINRYFTGSYIGTFTDVSDEDIRNIIAKRFVCIGNVIVSIGEIPNPDKITRLSYTNIQSNDSDPTGSAFEFTCNTEKYTDSYIMFVISHDDIGVTIFKLMKYAFPVNEFHI